MILIMYILGCGQMAAWFVYNSVKYSID